MDDPNGKTYLISYYVHPPEADLIATIILNLRDALTPLHKNLDTASINVCYDWRGHQKDLFWDETRPDVKKLGDYITKLSEMVPKYNNMNFMCSKYVTKAEYDAYMKSQGQWY